jgi:rhodanese-related sulfurtransferase
MKKLIAAAMLSTIAYAQQVPATRPTDPPTQHSPQAESKSKKLTRAELEKLLEHPDQLLLIDVRRPDEISSKGGFPVYLNIQVADLKNHLSEISKNKVIVTVSNHAARAGVAADLLAAHGFNVAGAVGVQTYEAEGGTVQKFVAPRSATNAEAQR